MPNSPDNPRSLSRRDFLKVAAGTAAGVLAAACGQRPPLVPDPDTAPATVLPTPKPSAPEPTATKEVVKPFVVSIESNDPRWPRRPAAEHPEDWFKNPETGMKQLEEAVLRSFSQAVAYPKGRFIRAEDVYEVLENPEKRNATPREYLKFFFQPPRKNDGTAQNPLILDASKGLTIRFVPGLGSSGDERVFSAITGQYYRIMPGDKRNTLDIDNGLMLDQSARSMTLVVLNGLWSIALHSTVSLRRSSFGDELAKIAPDVAKALGINFNPNEYISVNWEQAAQTSIFK